VLPGRSPPRPVPRRPHIRCLVRHDRVLLVIIGLVLLFRSLRQPVDKDGGDGWRVGQGVFFIICGALTALMIPLRRCPSGTTLSPVFRSCVDQDVSYPASSPGLPWRLGALALGSR
jgi:hypothetical protein